MSAPKMDTPPAPAAAELTDGESLQETRTFRERLLAALEENNRLLHELVELARAKAKIAERWRAKDKIEKLTRVKAKIETRKETK